MHDAADIQYTAAVLDLHTSTSWPPGKRLTGWAGAHLRDALVRPHRGQSATSAVTAEPSRPALTASRYAVVRGTGRMVVGDHGSIPVFSAVMTFAIGRDVLYRDYRGDGELVLVMPQRVVADDERGLLTWRPVGTPLLFRRTVDGRDRREIPFRLRHTVDWVLAPVTWTGLHVLHLFRPGHAHSVWWMFNSDFTLNCWYVNIEAPPVRWSDKDVAGVDTFDHALDIVVAPDRRWRWKDEDEYLERIGHPAYWTVEQAGEIRAEGQRVVQDIEAGRFPFDGTWCDFRAEPAWPSPTLPSQGWDRPQAVNDAA
jgi:hypothetical protein